jgi:hypothetical protein
MRVTADMVMAQPSGEPMAAALANAFYQRGLANFYQLNKIASRQYADDPNADTRREINSNYAITFAGCGAAVVQARLGTLQRDRVERLLGYLERQDFQTSIQNVLNANDDMDRRDTYVRQNAMRDLSNTPDEPRQHYWTGERDDEN